MDRLRILYHHRIRADDGQAVHVRELIAALREEGHEVRECALVPKADGDAAATAGSRASFWRRLRLPRLCIEALEIAYGSRGARRLVAAAGSWPHLVYERHALHCDAGLRAARALDVPLLLEVNSPMCDEMAQQGLLRFPRRARATERAVLRGADLVLTVSDVLRRRLCELGAAPERCLVVRNGADPRRYEGVPPVRAPDVPEGAFVLGFVGFVRAWHRLDLALTAMTDPRLARVHLVLAGDGPALPGIRERAQALGLVPRVHALGTVAAAALPGVVRGFDAALIPAINAYASPLKLFDALAAGVPIVAPAQDNLRELVRDGRDGLLFAPGDATALASCLAAVVADPARARAIGAAGRARLEAEDWTWRGNARRVAAAFAALAARREVTPPAGAAR